MKNQSLSADVTLELDEDEYALRPSLKAATAISNRFGGFNGALNAVANSDLAAYQFIVRQGVPLKAISTDDLNEAVWRAGTRNIMGDVMKFVTRLANGGRDPADTDDDDDEKGNFAAGETTEGNGEV